MDGAGAAFSLWRDSALCRPAGRGRHPCSSLALLPRRDTISPIFYASSVALGCFFWKATAERHETYGYRRAVVLAALVNALSLVVISFFIFYEAFQRIQHPEHVRAEVMIGVAAAGVVITA